MNTVKKILIANRSEIACRIIKTAKKMGIKTVAVYSDADSNALHVLHADEAVYIGKSSAAQSYLNTKNILNAVRISGADAVHPGYGFLSENHEFAQLIRSNGITFIGPSDSSIKRMGDKIEAKKIAQDAGVNVIPGYLGEIKSEKHALKIAKSIGYPIMLKAAAGGGGIGMRVVSSDDQMQQAYNSTKNEARNNFSDSRTFIEKLIVRPRHIEIQVLADRHGNIVCLSERDCSIQRHHQKVIEEAPSLFIDDKTRKKMYKQSVALSKKVGYFSAGTVEFIVDQKGNFYFLEMNTRLQVEHTVTELITGIDIVEQMINIASGKILPFKQKDIEIKGHAIESRIYAEDATCGFLPSTGRIIGYKEPQLSANVRVDSGVYEGGEVSMFYDAMIAKVCTFSQNRGKAIECMKMALGEYIIRGVSHNISFLQDILNNKKFQKNSISTSFIAEEYKEGFSGANLDDEKQSVVLCSAVFISLKYISRMAEVTGQLRGMSRTIGTRWVVKLDSTNYPVTVRNCSDGYQITFENQKFNVTSNWVYGMRLFQCVINDKKYSLQIEKKREALNIKFMGSIIKSYLFSPRTAELYKFMKSSESDKGTANLIAPITGLITHIKITEGLLVKRSQPLAVLEAMKMENILVSNVDGIVRKIYCKLNSVVNTGDVLAEIESSEVV
jgi:propionyl-CoA carboxylase alpha chain